jgi:hypothetical protein
VAVPILSVPRQICEQTKALTSEPACLAPFRCEASFWLGEALANSLDRLDDSIGLARLFEQVAMPRSGSVGKENRDRKVHPGKRRDPRVVDTIEWACLWSILSRRTLRISW